MKDMFKNKIEKIYNLSVNKQFIFFAGIAFSAVLIFMAVSWLKTPIYSMLLSSLSSGDQQAVLKVLDENSIPYKMLPSSGSIAVPQTVVNKARMLLAKHGLPKVYQNGYDLLTKSQGIYTNEMTEELLKKKILEDNLQRAIKTINGVEAVKVQLALPKHTEFMQKQSEPKASVILQLRQGVGLTDDQVQGISHLVSSSIPYMKSTDVTIVDQNGALLSANFKKGFSAPANEIKYRTQVEEKLRQQILHVLTPIVGNDNIRVEVNATVDFDKQSNTTEKFLPNKNAVESQQDDTSVEGGNTPTAGGVPGALSNQPPGKSKFAPKPTGGKAPPLRNEAPLSKHDRHTKNFALGKSITHTNFSSGVVKNLSIAILLNYQKIMEDNKEILKALPTNEISLIENLAKRAVGFSVARGDQIAIASARFSSKPLINPVDANTPIPLMQQVWFIELTKGSVVLLGILLFGLFIWKPFQKHLFESNVSAGVDKLADNMSADGASHSVEQPVKSNTTESMANQTKDTVSNSPQDAASVVKGWVKQK